MRPPSPRLAAAFDYAREAHGAQTRKGTAIPYISHLMGVSALVMENGGDEDQAIAGLLHDVLEDCGAEHESVIRERFGERVAGIVVDLTDGVPDPDGRKEPWRLRKERFLARHETMAADSLLVSLCDKLHNARAIGADLRAGQTCSRASARMWGVRASSGTTANLYVCSAPASAPTIRSSANSTASSRRFSSTLERFLLLAAIPRR